MGWSSFWQKIGNNLDNFAASIDREINAELAAKRKYAGTRIVEVALRLYEDRGYTEFRDFWSLWKEDRDRHFKEAEEQLRTNPKCWGPFYKWKRRFQKSLFPIAWFLDQINRLDMSFKWHARLYHWSHNLDWHTGNWNIICIDPVRKS